MCLNTVNKKEECLEFFLPVFEEMYSEIRSNAKCLLIYNK